MSKLELRKEDFIEVLETARDMGIYLYAYIRTPQGALIITPFFRAIDIETFMDFCEGDERYYITSYNPYKEVLKINLSLYH